MYTRIRFGRVKTRSDKCNRLKCCRVYGRNEMKINNNIVGVRTARMYVTACPSKHATLRTVKFDSLRLRKSFVIDHGSIANNVVRAYYTPSDHRLSVFYGVCYDDQTQINTRCDNVRRENGFIVSSVIDCRLTVHTNAPRVRLTKTYGGFIDAN